MTTRQNLPFAFALVLAVGTAQAACPGSACDDEAQAQALCNQSAAGANAQAIAYGHSSRWHCLASIHYVPNPPYGHTVTWVPAVVLALVGQAPPPTHNWYDIFLWHSVQPRPTPKTTGAAVCRFNPDASECSNPIDGATGNKHQPEVDFEVSPLLRFTRYYNSSAAALTRDMGEKWSHTYSRAILTSAPVNGLETVNVLRPAGNRIQFVKTSGIWSPDQDVHYQLSEVVDGGGQRTGWAFHEGDALQIEEYDTLGRLAAIRRKDGRFVELTYNHGQSSGDANDFRLTQVSDQAGRTIEFEFDTQNRIIEIIDPAGASHGYSYDGAGLLVSVTRPSTTTRTYHYDEPAQVGVFGEPDALTGITDENGQRFASYYYKPFFGAYKTEHYGQADRFEFRYQPDGSTVVDTPDGASAHYEFATIHGVRRPVEVTRSCTGCTDRVTTYSYDANGRIDLVTAADGTVTNWDYDSRALLTQVVESVTTAANRRTTQTDWHSTYAVPLERRVFDSSSASPGILVGRTVWTYNARGQALTESLIDPTTSVARAAAYSYCESTDVATPNSTCPVLGYLKSIDGPQPGTTDTTTYTYHPATDLTGCASTGPCHRKGDLHQVTAPGGLTTTYARYDLAGRPTRVLDANGVATDLEYNLRGWLTARKVRGANDGTEADDAITRLVYDNVGQVTKVTQPDGAFLEFTYDQAHRLTGIEDNLGNTVTYTLDGAGNRISEETRDAGNVLTHSLSRVYDQLGQLETLADALSTPTDFTYDAVGNVDTVTDAFNRTTDNDYDPLGRLKRSIANVGGTGPERAETQFQYDALDNLTAVIDPKGLTTSYAYNGLGDLVTLTSPDTGSTTYTYDAAGNRASQTDARGVTAGYSYDALNRLTAIDLPTPGQDIGFSYDTAPTVCAPGETFATGRLSGFTDPSGSTSYCYDRGGNVVRKVQSVTGTPDATVGYTHNAADRLVAMTYPSGAVVTYLRDATGRITGVTAQPTAGSAAVTVVADVDYLAFGPATAMTFGNGRVLDKTYDANYGIDGITDSAVDGLDLDYTLDAIGNVTGLAERTTGGPTATRSIDYDDLDRLEALKDGPTTVQGFTYDATGNRASKTTSTTEAYTYPTDSHRLTQAGATARGYDAAGNTTTIGTGRVFTYDDRGRMSQLTDGGVLTREYAYNARGERVVKRDPTTTGNDIHYVYDEAGRLLGEYDEAGARIKEYVWLDETLVAVLGSHGSSDLQYVLTDHLGTPRAVVHPTTNALLWRWDLTGSAFGDHTANEDPDGDTVAYPFNLRYPGQYFDAESGLHYNYFRDYDPVTGRYVQSDPIGLGGGLTTFSYAGSNPLWLIDPHGLQYQNPWNQLRNAVQVGSRTFNVTEYLSSKGMVSASVSYGGAGQLGPYYTSAESGFALDLTGRLCYISTLCSGAGKPALFAEVGFTGGLSGSKVCPGTSYSEGFYTAGGRGILNNSQVLSGPDGWSANRQGLGVGVSMPGASRSVGGLTCKQETICSLW